MGIMITFSRLLRSAFRGTSWTSWGTPRWCSTARIGHLDTGQRYQHCRLQREHSQQVLCGEQTLSYHTGRREAAVTMDMAISMMRCEYQNTWSQENMSSHSGGIASAALRCGHLVLISGWSEIY